MRCVSLRLPYTVPCDSLQNVLQRGNCSLLSRKRRLLDHSSLQRDTVAMACQGHRASGVSSWLPRLQLQIQCGGRLEYNQGMWEEEVGRLHAYQFATGSGAVANWPLSTACSHS